VPSKKKQADVVDAVTTIKDVQPADWNRLMQAIDAAFVDPAETCKYLQSDTKRVPKVTGGKTCELVCLPLMSKAA
jgi:hypothetical protein